ncbi:MAG: DUF4337 domain-containing protein [Hyphomicrobiaceae bacterium]
MSMDDVLDSLKTDAEELKKWIGVYIGVLAVLLPVCNVGGANAAKDATRANIEASNVWAFYQATNVRRTVYSATADELEAMLATQAGIVAEARKALEDKIKLQRSEVAPMKSEPETGDGMDQLFTKAKSLEKDRDIALRKDPYFDWRQALLQIAIVLASVHLIIGNLLLWASAGGWRRSASC